MKKKVYISIPISGYPLVKVRERADIVKGLLSRKGYSVVSPFDVLPCKNPTYSDYICYDLLAMLDCDAIYFCDGWEQSCGCNIEHDVAMRFKAHGKKNFQIMYES